MIGFRWAKYLHREARSEKKKLRTEGDARVKESVDFGLGYVFGLQGIVEAVDWGEAVQIRTCAGMVADACRVGRRLDVAHYVREGISFDVIARVGIGEVRVARVAGAYGMRRRGGGASSCRNR